MKKKLLLLSIVLVISFTMACNSPVVFPFIEATPEQNTGECETSEPTQKDIEDILSFYKNTFNMPGWERSYTVMPDRVAVTWLNDDLGGLTYFENLLFGCGGAYDQIDEYLSTDSFETIFVDYDSYEEAASCKKGGLRLHQFDVINQGQSYQIRFWAEPQSDTRVFITMLVFPTGSPPLDRYAEALYPQLTECR